METLVHNGATYVKVSVLAKKYKYTTDYIGQLCRAGKVKATLVGRAWFVREDSLKDHMTERYKSVRSGEILSKNSSSVDPVLEKVLVYPRVSKHIHRHFETHTLPVPGATPATSVKSIQSAYQSDSNFVGLSVQSPSKLISSLPAQVIEPIVPTFAQPVTVTDESKIGTKLSFSPLPEISIRGNLVVRSLDTEDEYALRRPATSAKVSVRTISDPAGLINQPGAVNNSLNKQFNSGCLPGTQLKVSQTAVPALVATKALSNWIFFPLIIVISFGCVLVILSLSSFVVSDGLVFSQSFKFNVTEGLSALEFLLKNNSIFN